MIEKIKIAFYPLCSPFQGRLKRSVLSIFILFFSNSFTQELSAYLNHDRVKMGEPVELKLVVKLAENSKISFEPYEKEIPAVVKKEGSQVNQNRVSVDIIKDFKDTTRLIGNKIRWEGSYSLVAWDTGKIVLPNQKITIDDSTFLFNEVVLTISSETIGVQDELFDIEEGFADIPDKPTFLQLLKEYWYVITGVVLLLGAILFLIIRRKKQPKKAQKIMSLKDRTLFAINALDKQKMWMNGQLKQHYTELSHIMRSYLSSRYSLNLLERTTFETRILLSQAGLPSDTVDTLMTILKQADMVKFANSTVDELNIMKVSMLAKQIVAETSPLEIEN
jgi:hypothetical protein